jgi:hypothetical protein
MRLNMQKGKLAVTENDKGKQVHLSLNLTLPNLIGAIKHLRAPGEPRAAKFSRKQWYTAIAALAILAVGVSGSLLITHLFSRPKEGKSVLSDNTASSSPNFKSLLPSGGSSKDTALKYDQTRKVTTFTDVIDGVSITISEQELPEAFKTDTDRQVEKMAKNFNATEVINESSPRIYLGTSIKGPQTAIFHKNGILVFIQSANTIDKHPWVAYITKLQ